MGFLISVILLIICGVIIVYINVRGLFKILKNEFVKMRLIPVFTIITLSIFYIVGVSLFLNIKWIEKLWLTLGYKSGLDLMLSNFLFQVDYSFPITNKYILATSIIVFCSYPLWLYLGLQIGFILFGVNEKQTGFIGLLFFKPHPQALPPPLDWRNQKKDDIYL